MNLFDRMFACGSTLRLLLLIGSLIVLAIYITREPGHRTGAFVIFVVGSAGTIRELWMWYKKRRTFKDYLAGGE